MTHFDRITLGRLSKELGFVRDTFEKVCRLTEVLSFISDDPLLSETLALKGGTAINLTIFDVPRLSVDIDLDYSRNVTREPMLKERTEITARIRKYMTAARYSLSPKSKQYHALDSFVYDYQNAGGVKDNLKIEINYMLRCHVLPLCRRKAVLPWDKGDLTVLSVDPLEIFSAKTAALLNRAAPRDLYDLYNLQRSELIDAERADLYRKCVIFYCAIASEQAPDSFVFTSIDTITPQKIRTELFPVLSRSERFDLTPAQQAVKGYLFDMLTPNDEELLFWRSFREGRYEPWRLFAEKEILSRIENHPMAIWKCSRISSR